MRRAVRQKHRGPSVPTHKAGGSALAEKRCGGTGTGVVWVIQGGTTVVLPAYHAVKFGAPLPAASAGSWSNSHGNAFVTAMEANGRVHVPAYKSVTVFGMGPSLADSN
ncbi:MAG TPA: hypothetical protein VHX61_16955 [Rhizomicrobium sp.]|nr:hypothetical protein [Rhizomicrobium sp.]